MQLKLNFGTVIEKEFEESFTISIPFLDRTVETYCHTSRKAGITFLSVGSINFVGKPSFGFFRALSKDKQDGFINHIIPNLQELSLEEIKTFARNIHRIYKDKDKCVHNYLIGHYEFRFESVEKITTPEVVQKSIELYKTISSEEKEKLNLVAEENGFIEKAFVASKKDKQLFKNFPCIELIKRLIENGIASKSKGGFLIDRDVMTLIKTNYKLA